MSLAEIAKRFIGLVSIIYSRIKYNEPIKSKYIKIARYKDELVLEKLSGELSDFNPQKIHIFSDCIDLTRKIDWHTVDFSKKKWPNIHWSRINCRPGNYFGDIRINWELNRLQFLPHLSLVDPKLTLKVIKSWLQSNPYLYGPAYISSMEVAIRWISIYRSACLIERYFDRHLRIELTGLGIASGRYIISRLSTNSSAGNHLIVESVGLFWIAKALNDTPDAIRWRRIARKLLWEQIPAQIHPDGSPKEQSFWYLGFVLDAVCNYLMLEDKDVIPETFLQRIKKAFEFVDAMVTINGDFPDFGDRDDGYVFRDDHNYTGSLFCRLLTIGGNYFSRGEWIRDISCGQGWFPFYTGDKKSAIVEKHTSAEITGAQQPSMKTYPDGGMTMMKRGDGQLLFRHSHLGLGNTCGHGHADALSVLFYWKQKPVLIDNGSGQYNGDQNIRNYFRSTLAHNTVEIGGKNQAEIVGPFLWKQSYQTRVTDRSDGSDFFIEAEHDGYDKEFSIIHRRKVEWGTDRRILITDSFHGKGEQPMKGAFHLGPCSEVQKRNGSVVVDFGTFRLKMRFPANVKIFIENGSVDPFIGWRGMRYARWEPIDAILFSCVATSGQSYQIELSVD